MDPFSHSSRPWPAPPHELQSGVSLLQLHRGGGVARLSAISGCGRLRVVLVVGKNTVSLVDRAIWKFIVSFFHVGLLDQRGGVLPTSSPKPRVWTGTLALLLTQMSADDFTGARLYGDRCAFEVVIYLRVQHGPVQPTASHDECQGRNLALRAHCSRTRSKLKCCLVQVFWTLVGKVVLWWWQCQGLA